MDIQLNKTSSANNELLNWLTSFLPIVSSQLDGSYITSQHEQFCGENNSFGLNDFYDCDDQTTDIDKYLTSIIKVSSNDLNNCSPHCNNTHDYATNTQIFGNNEFIDFVFDDCAMCTAKQNELKKCVEIYSSGCIFIPPGIILSHVSILFKLIIKLAIENGMFIKVPEIVFSSGKYSINYNSSHRIITPKQKQLFYEFCYNQTTKLKNKTTQYFCKPPPITTKEMIGRHYLNTTLTLNRNNKLKTEENDDNTPYKSISYEDTKKILDHINEQCVNYNNWIIYVWDNVFVPYLDKNNCDRCVLDKLCSPYGSADDNAVYDILVTSEGGRNKGVFRKFFEDLPQYQKLLKIQKRAKLTMTNHNAIYRTKITKDREKQRNLPPTRIDTRKLVGTFDQVFN